MSSNKYSTDNILISNIQEETLKFQIATALGIEYHKKATLVEAEPVTSVVYGTVYGRF